MSLTPVAIQLHRLIRFGKFERSQRPFERETHVNLALGAAGVALLAACAGGGAGSHAAGGDTLSERQRDSMLAHSRIPGAAGVGRAMNVADSTSARVRATDSVGP
jgi:hypothetical protein